MTATPVQTFARERRVELAYDEYPPLVVQAFISAEDKTFFSHGGIDYPGLIGAVFDFTTKTVDGGGRARGGSTITQQVAKYLLQDSELCDRPQDPRGDPRLPARIHAQQAADPRALPQFDLPRPQRLWRPGRQPRLFRQGRQRADPARGGLSRRPAQGAVQLRPGPRDAEGARPPQLRPARDGQQRLHHRGAACAPPRQLRWARSATAATRNSASRAAISWKRSAATLLKRFGEKAEDGPNSLYAGGLWVRTSMNPMMQDAAAERLARGPGAVRWRPRLARHSEMSVDLDGDWAGAA